MKNTNTIEISTFILCIIGKMVNQGITKFDCSYTNNYYKTTIPVENPTGNIESFDKHLELFINEYVFKFIKKNYTNGDTVELIDIEFNGYDNNLEYITNIDKENLLFIDDLYDDVFENIDFEDIFNECMNDECKCFTCKNITCTLKQCQFCKDNTNKECILCSEGVHTDYQNIDMTEFSIQVKK